MNKKALKVAMKMPTKGKVGYGNEKARSNAPLESIENWKKNKRK